MTRAVLIAALLSISGAATAQPAAKPPPPPPACTDAAHHAFDFWIGRWAVFDTRTGEPAGHSVIEGLYGGCALRENWSEPGYTGGSLNTYDAASGQWRQTWTDSANTWREFVGGMDAGKMVLVWRHPSLKAPGQMARERMIFTANADGTVRQFSDASPDDGKTWVVRYDYTYRPEPKG